MHRIVLLFVPLFLAAGASFAQQPEEPPRPRPTFQSCFRPDYPPDSLRREEEGRTTLAFLVPAGDAAPEVKVVGSSGFKSLDAGAFQKATQCLADAEVRAGLAPDRWYRQSILWELR